MRGSGLEREKDGRMRGRPPRTATELQRKRGIMGRENGRRRKNGRKGIGSHVYNQEWPSLKFFKFALLPPSFVNFYSYPYLKF